jgi:hypothetical protein
MSKYQTNQKVMLAHRCAVKMLVAANNRPGPVWVRKIENMGIN